MGHLRPNKHSYLISSITLTCIALRTEQRLLLLLLFFSFYMQVSHTQPSRSLFLTYQSYSFIFTFMYLLGTQIHPSFDLYSQTETIAAAAIVFV